MSEPSSALPGATFEGFVTVHEAGLRGMITLRGDLASAKLQAAVKKLTGVAVPEGRQIALNGENGAAWMSPDELLILLPYDKAPAAVAALQKALKGTHHLLANVSDARAVFRLDGQGGREVLAKLSPADLSTDGFRPGDFRRTRLAQVAAAFWMDRDGSITLVCFRSVAGYVFGVLQHAAMPGAEVDFF